jgi:hypothetical protein
VTVFAENATTFATRREQFHAMHVNEALNDLDRHLAEARTLDDRLAWVEFTEVQLLALGVMTA